MPIVLTVVQKWEVVRMVVIKDMEMPSCCGECNLTTCKGKDEPWNYCCSITLTNINLDDTQRPSDCPLVEIQERKQGKWILHEENSASSSYHCSVCNRLINVLWSEELSDYPYCHCGAEMRGENNV